MLDRPLAKIENLQVRFATRQGVVAGVEDVSFDVFPGETLCIVGESGSGKSVSALSLMRLVEFGGGEITGGRVRFEAEGTAQDLTQATADTMRHLRGNDIAMIFQEPMTALNPVFTVERQLTEGLRQHEGLSRKAARDRALDLLQQVRLPEPERRLRQYPHELSGGMRQRVVIAMALACRPRLLIADEPTTALDVTTQAEILALINRLKAETGAAVLFITHDMAVVAQVADRVVVMQDGRKVEEGPVNDIFERPKATYTKALLKAVPRLGQGSTVSEVADTGPPLLKVNNLTTRFAVKGGMLRRTVAELHAVTDVSFSLQPGRTLALVGESGSGKSTVGRSILRLVKPTSGTVQFDGQDVLALNTQGLRTARSGMQMIFQDPYASLNPQRRVADQAAEPLWNYAPMPRQDTEARVAELFDRVHLPQDLLQRYPHELSGGQRQRVAIARALALSPKLIVADEAVSALDVSVQAEVLSLLRDLQADLGLSFLFISHDMAVVEQMSHEIAVMYLGRIVERGPRDAVLRDPRHSYTKALLSAVPVPNPKQRIKDDELNFKPIPSPIHKIGHDPGPSIYQEVTPGHHVLISDSGYD
ncbi:ABC transporter ATP-binding protein [Roseovarius rhodophyticola]|uniref:ABC transporter ATP-binding protein n=1 Tax=Roseovarius rhodophyticola TaxID=3080827 RepID=A0ABZ2TJL7_9RHOB|nr:ABC transporter ATP-binding protein [Roseovarius sp. W115]MDV2928541.1 ABC transporter ATP-binding protein [Roseovarius sp. W115]